MSRASESSDPIEDESEIDRLIADESVSGGSMILQQLREELSAGEDQLRRMGEDLVAARDEQDRLGQENVALSQEKAGLETELNAAKSAAESFKRERDGLGDKIRDMIKVSEAEMTKIIDHTERLQHLRFSQDEVANLQRRLQDLEAALTAERALSAKRLEDLTGTQAHRDILEQKISGMLSVMHAETQKIVDHTERQFASVVEGIEARQRVAAATVRGDALEGQGLAIQATLESTQATLAESQATLAAVYRSTSWRLTKPWRLAGRILARAGVKRAPR